MRKIVLLAAASLMFIAMQPVSARPSREQCHAALTKCVTLAVQRYPNDCHMPMLDVPDFNPKCKQVQYCYNLDFKCLGIEYGSWIGQEKYNPPPPPPRNTKIPPAGLLETTPGLSPQGPAGMGTPSGGGTPIGGLSGGRGKQ
jgi:hypothetical protein